MMLERNPSGESDSEIWKRVEYIEMMTALRPQTHDDSIQTRGLTR